MYSSRHDGKFTSDLAFLTDYGKTVFICWSIRVPTHLLGWRIREPSVELSLLA